MDRIAAEVKELIDGYVSELRKLGVTPTRVLLFGSQACGTAHACSDIDLLVVSPDFDAIAAPDRPRILARANRPLMAPIQALWVTPRGLETASPASFYREILRDGIDVPPPAD